MLVATFVKSMSELTTLKQPKMQEPQRNEGQEQCGDGWQGKKYDHDQSKTAIVFISTAAVLIL